MPNQEKVTLAWDKGQPATVGVYDHEAERPRLNLVRAAVLAFAFIACITAVGLIGNLAAHPWTALSEGYATGWAFAAGFELAGAAIALVVELTRGEKG